MWGGNSGDKKICWKAWNTICKPKKEGGLGVKNFRLFNISLLAKLKWQFLFDHDAIWRDLLTYRYSDLCKKLMCHSGTKWGKNESIWWRDIL